MIVGVGTQSMQGSPLVEYEPLEQNGSLHYVVPETTHLILPVSATSVNQDVH